MKLLSITAIVAATALLTPNVSAFTPTALRTSSPLIHGGGSRTAPVLTVLSATEEAKETEKQLRKEIEARNSLVKDEGQYAVADGDRLSAGLDEEQDSMDNGSAAAAHDDALSETMERLTKPRAYPLFLAEKAAEVLESTLQDFLPGPTDDAPNGTKERLVILGTGWGSAAFLSEIDSCMYDVTVISPRNYFLFTPMLAGASVGTVEFRSITEPIRQLNGKAMYMEATATSVDPDSRTITCESVICDGNACDIEDFTVEYDRLLVTVGAQTNTFGIPGVREHCNYLRQIEDARRVRTSIVNCFERANLPHLTDEERVKNLTFAVIGAGPTGIEFAAELRDFIEQDGPKFYPNLLKFVRIKVIEASGTVLAPFDKSLQEEAIAQMNRQVEIKDPEVAKLLPDRFKLVELLLESSVKEVTEKTIFLNDGSSLDYGLSVWAAGNGPLPFTLDLIEKLGEEQASQQDSARGRIATDPWMRAYGSKGSVIAFGDCSCITQGMLPATAQVASQQGEYLAKLMNKKYDLSPEVSQSGVLPPPTKQKSSKNATPSLSDVIASVSTKSIEYAKPFQFLNLGILAYTGGGSALAQVSAVPDTDPIKGTGQVGNAVWKAVYLSKQFSVRNRLLVLNDWTNRQIFGRDITRL